MRLELVDYDTEVAASADEAFAFFSESEATSLARDPSVERFAQNVRSLSLQLYRTTRLRDLAVGPHSSSGHTGERIDA